MEVKELVGWAMPTRRFLYSSILYLPVPPCISSITNESYAVIFYSIANTLGASFGVSLGARIHHFGVDYLWGILT